MANYFLDTSIQVERIIGDRRDQLDDFLLDKRLLTSKYVLMEFKRSLLDDLITLHTYLIEEGDITKALKRITNIQYKHRSLQRMVKILIGVIESLYDQKYTNEILYKKALERVTDLIEQELIELFYADISEGMIDKTKCGLADNEPVKILNTYDLEISCRRFDELCDLDKFAELYIEEFRKINIKINDILKNRKKYHQILKKINIKNLKNVEKTIDIVIKNFNAIKGLKNCSRLGDCIISIESPENSILLTTDNFFDISVNAIGKKLKIF